MTPTETTSVRAAAARNNAEWCASVCRSHGIPNTLGETAWHSARRTPPYYPDAVTVHPDAVPADFLPEVDTATPGCSIKDSFAALDLTADGFVELFTAQWIHRPAGTPTRATPVLRTQPVTTAAQLYAWQTAWNGGDGSPDVFRPALLDDPSVLVLAFHRGEDLCGGVVLNRGSGVVGLSNLFTTDDSDPAAAWTSAITAAAAHFPGLPQVGYEHGDDLAHARAAGFSVLGPLRVWLHDS
ncbi:hypothetical protein LE181_02945 [Streptomyces sp. SCA3-4]|uniref:hypothetical protein n=1 Tax=Streptomyces sichuanensis TaxID=2871810 RepID=UPI001CE3773C|nr:hypothetical protein [Streptomyces sichuanensis]MCA6091127.1 hypothetical protein [Streptomyces sichuanensis]